MPPQFASPGREAPIRTRGSGAVPGRARNASRSHAGQTSPHFSPGHGCGRGSDRFRRVERGQGAPECRLLRKLAPYLRVPAALRSPCFACRPGKPSMVCPLAGTKCHRHFVCLRLALRALTRVRLAKTSQACEASGSLTISTPSLATWGEMRAKRVSGNTPQEWRDSPANERLVPNTPAAVRIRDKPVRTRCRSLPDRVLLTISSPAGLGILSAVGIIVDQSSLVVSSVSQQSPTRSAWCAGTVEAFEGLRGGGSFRVLPRLAHSEIAGAIRNLTCEPWTFHHSCA